jgi:hypothetical protein
MRPFTIFLIFLILISGVFIGNLGLEVAATVSGQEQDPLPKFLLLAIWGVLLAGSWLIFHLDRRRRQQRGQAGTPRA